MTRENLRRAGMTAVALAMTVGCVFLMRQAARRVAAGVVEATARGEEARPARVPAPRTYDLAKLVPEALRLNVGGIAIASEKKRLAMPLDLAVKTSEQEARAQGWKPFDLPLATEIALLAAGGGFYITPEGTVIRRTHAALRGGDTLREDFKLPARYFLGLKENLTLDEAVALKSAETLALLPQVLRAVQTATLYFTQLTARGGGVSLVVVGLSTWDERDARLQQLAAFSREGWKPHEGIPGAWTKANLTAVADVAPRGDGGGSIVSIRYSDDEVILNNEEQGDL